MTERLYLRILNCIFAVLQCALLAIPGVGDIPIDQTFQRANTPQPRIVPSDYAFAIWLPIFAGSIIYAFYSLINNHSQMKLSNKIATYALGVFISGSIYDIVARFYVTNPLTAIAYIPTLYFLIRILIIISSYPRAKDIDYWLTVPAFGLYAGWSSIAISVNIASSLQYYGYDGYPVGEKFMSVVGIIIVLTTALAIYNRTKNNWYWLAVMWAFIGIMISSINLNYNDVFIFASLAIIVFGSTPFFLKM